MLPLTETLRIARVLHRVWAARVRPVPDTTRTWRDLETLVADARRAQHRVLLAARYRLHLTEANVRGELHHRLEKLVRQVKLLTEEQRPTPPAPALRIWFDEVRQLEAEFGSVQVRWPDEVLRVVTDPIVLEGVELGPFAIEFGWDVSRRFRGDRAFEVIALEPNPATGRDEVVHPHVEGHRLCAGDAADSLRQAVDEGRIAEAFLLVQSVLSTYNARSPYVPLSEWEGFHCGNCGQRGDVRASSRCDACDSGLCDECSDSCSRCADTHCPDCLTNCAVCDERFCRGCLVAIPSERRICSACRIDCPTCGTQVASDEVEDGRCGSCLEPDPELSESESPSLEKTHAA